MTGVIVGCNNERVFFFIENIKAGTAIRFVILCGCQCQYMMFFQEADNPYIKFFYIDMFVSHKKNSSTGSVLLHKIINLLLNDKFFNG
jgi:hypothetical protein